MPATPLGGALLPLAPLPPLGTPTPGLTRDLNRSGDFRPPFAWSPDGVWLGFIRRGDLWALNTRTGDEQRLAPADSFAWGGRAASLVVRPVPTYPPTPTPTPLPPTVVESPSVLLFDPHDPAVILGGTAAGVVRRSGDSGWFLSNQGINYPTRVRTLAFDPAEPNVVYAGTDGQRAIAGSLYKSIDGGKRWTVTGLRDVDVYHIVIDHQISKAVYAATSKGVYVSSDGGFTWAERNNGLKSTTVTALAVDPSPPTGSGRGTPPPAGPLLYLGTRQGEVYKSTNGGGEWRLIQTLNTPVTSLVAYRKKAGTIFATTEDGLFTSNDSGETWNQVSGGIWKVRLNGLVPTGKDSTVYAYGAQGVFVSHDGGVNWGPASTGLEGTQPSALAIHPTTPSLLWVGTDKGVYRSSNGGVTWSR